MTLIKLTETENGRATCSHCYEVFEPQRALNVPFMHFIKLVEAGHYRARFQIEREMQQFAKEQHGHVVFVEDRSSSFGDLLIGFSDPTSAMATYLKFA